MAATNQYFLDILNQLIDVTTTGKNIFQLKQDGLKPGSTALPVRRPCFPVGGGFSCPRGLSIVVGVPCVCVQPSVLTGQPVTTIQ